MYPRCTYDMAVSSHQFVDKKIAENGVLVYTAISHISCALNEHGKISIDVQVQQFIETEDGEQHYSSE